VWKRLTHPNILPLLGITISPHPQLISDLMPGNLRDYLGRNPEADRLKLVDIPPFAFIGLSSHHKLFGLAEGLNYLHSSNVIHGGLQGVRGCSKSRLITILTSGQSNILVDHVGHVRIAGFGLTTLLLDTSPHHSYNLRWTAPEILGDDTKPYTKQADIFSFAMVMIEVRHGRPTTCRTLVDRCFVSMQIFNGGWAPFHPITASRAKAWILDGKRPPRPKHPAFTEDLWRLMQNCWDQDPQSRPAVSNVLRSVFRSFR